MENDSLSPSAADRFFARDVQDQLEKVFEAIPNEVKVYLFADPEDKSREIELGRDLLAAFQEVTDKIQIREYDLSHKIARKLKIDRSPTIAFAPDSYSIRYLGIPLGEEGRTLVETIVLVGLKTANLNEQTQKVLGRIGEPRKLRVFVSPTCPYCPQQAVNAIKAAIERPDMISVEIVDTSFNTDLAERYQAFSVPQTFADDVLIAKGAQPQELFAASLEKMEEQSYFIPETDAERVETDVVIIGGGPAGLTAGIYAARSGLKAVIIERDTLGGQVATTPVVENYPGLAHTGGKNLVDIMVQHALEYVRIFPRETVLEIQAGQPMEITTSLRRFATRAILFATGATHKRLGVPGESRYAGRGVSYCSTCDGPLFKERNVVMVGGGNSAVTEALHLHHIGAKVSLAHRRDHLRAQEQLVKDLDEKGIPVLWNTEIKEIRGEGTVRELVLYNNRTGGTETMEADGLFVSIGYEPEVELARKIGVELTGDGYIKHDGQHRTNVPGIYSAGDVEGGYKQIVTAAGAGAGAAMTIFEDLTHPYWKEESRNRMA
ncbi:MAG: FAD-dependent oxidoreductase [Proteobacteria bacterium]|nr:FAD-dependent oxidoreductase [Pseudomonadota bacterium]